MFHFGGICCLCIIGDGRGIEKRREEKRREEKRREEALPTQKFNVAFSQKLFPP